MGQTRPLSFVGIGKPQPRCKSTFFRISISLSWLPVSSQTSRRSSASTTSPKPRAWTWFTNSVGTVPNSLPPHQQPETTQLKQPPNLVTQMTVTQRKYLLGMALLSALAATTALAQSDPTFYRPLTL